MVFASTEFLFLFFPTLLILYFFPTFRQRLRYRNIVLLLFSLAFYAWGEPIFVFCMISSILFNWGAGYLIDNSGSSYVKKTTLTISVLCNVLLLFVFKYATFFASNLECILGRDSSHFNIVLPIGISFFTFQNMSYVFDIYYGKSKTQLNLLYVALYISLFPQLIAGPIVRYSQIENELKDRHIDFEKFSSGLERFVWGLGKKVLLANYLGAISDQIFNVSIRCVASAWLGAFAYSLQIYFDFSGYSDMAIGLGEIFGFEFPENFNYPYIAGSVTEFWRRWHITLSRWFRDYVYMPLGGNRVNRSRWIVNMLVVWLMTGVWHGANWTFVIWGGYYCILLILERISGISKRNTGIAGQLYTKLAIIIGWVIFRADNISDGWTYIRNMFGFSTNGFVDGMFFKMLANGLIVIIIGFLLSTPIMKLLYVKVNTRARKQTAEIAKAICCVLIFVISVTQIVASSYNPFIYFNF